MLTRFCSPKFIRVALHSNLCQHSIVHLLNIGFNICKNMNWTGGRLSRHSGAANTAGFRRKQHFAMAGRQKQPRRIPDDNFYDATPPPTGRNRRREATPGPSNVQTVVAQEQAVEYVSKRSRSSTVASSTSAKSNLHEEQEEVVRDDINANYRKSTRRRSSHRRPSTIASSISANSNPQEDLWAEKRRKILQKGDWVGASIQKPLKLMFPSTQSRMNVGRRRKIHEGDGARFSGQHTTITSHFPKRDISKKLISTAELGSRRSSEIRDSCQYQTSKLDTSEKWNLIGESTQRIEAKRGNVRISIGTRVVPPGISSSSAPPRNRSLSAATNARTEASSSDVMLLGPEERSVSHGEVIGNGKGKEIGRHFGADVLIRQDNNRKPGADSCRNHNSQADSIDSRSNVYHPSSASHQSLAKDRIEFVKYNGDVTESGSGSWAGFSGSSQVGHDSIQGQPESNEAFNIPQRSGRPVSISSPLNFATGDQSGRVVFSSSSTSVQHPAPQSAPQSEKISRLLRSSSSDIAESTMVNVGGTQVLDNEIWQSWAVKENSPAPVGKCHISLS
jgi:hypothetical protein